jgi:type II secretory pathway component PulF
MMKGMEVSIKVKEIYSLVIKDIDKGVSLSKSIENNEIKIDSLLLNLIKNGELSGNLSDALLKAYTYIEKRNEMKRKIVGTLIYPSFIIVSTIAMTLFLIMYIFPKILPLLSSLNVPLPLITKIVLGIYHILVSYGLYILVISIVVIAVSRIVYVKSNRVRYIFHNIVLRIGMYRTMYISSFCTMGEMIIQSGRSLPDMISFARDGSYNLVYRVILNEIYKESLRGVSFSVSISKHIKYFPRLIIDMSSIGEKTGNFALMLGNCGRILEQDIDNTLKKVSSLIEPVLMVFMGLIVGSVAISIILPVYEITNHISK